MLKAWNEEPDAPSHLRPVDGVEDGFVPVIGRPDAPPVNEEQERKKILREKAKYIHDNLDRFRDSIIKANCTQQVATY